MEILAKCRPLSACWTIDLSEDMTEIHESDFYRVRVHIWKGRKFVIKRESAFSKTVKRLSNEMVKDIDREVLSMIQKEMGI